MNWIQRAALKWSNKRNQEELKTWIHALSTMSESEMTELSFLVALTANKVGLTKNGQCQDLLLLASTGGAQSMAKVSDSMRGKSAPFADAATVWGHTFRGQLDPELQSLVRLMWVEIGRGLPALKLWQASSDIEIQNEDTRFIYEVHERLSKRGY